MEDEKKRIKISEKGLNLLKYFESFEGKAYKCPAKVWTVGWGFTRINGVGVKEGDTITLEEANTELIRQLKSYENAVKEVIDLEKINQNRYDALVSLCYNIGTTGFKGSDIVKLVNSRNFIGACRIFNLWSSAAKKRSKGLLRRRMSERNLFCSWPDPIVKTIPKNYRETFREL